MCLRHSKYNVSPTEFILPTPALFLLSVITRSVMPSVSCPTPHRPSPIIGSETWQSLTPLCISLSTPPITKFCPFDLPNNSHTLHFPPSALPWSKPPSAMQPIAVISLLSPCLWSENPPVHSVCSSQSHLPQTQVQPVPPVLCILW